MAKVTLTGFKEFEAKLKRLPATLLQEVDGVTEDAAQNWAGRAIQAAPVDQGRIRQGISTNKVKAADYEVVSNADYSAFVEWGTKTKVRVPAGLSAYAAEFRGGNGATDPKKFIYDWCKRKGIDPKLWFVIYRSIMVKGITPQPFFFPQMPIVRQEWIADIKTILSRPH